jgi:V8-like Glu-specific endopeptidase
LASAFIACARSRAASAARLALLLTPTACGAPSSEGEVLGEVEQGAIIGADNRVVERNTTTLPWAAHVAFRVINDIGQTSRCTGALIGKSTILTAAHCVYRHDRPGHERHNVMWAMPGADYPALYEGGNPYPYGAWNWLNCAVERYPAQFSSSSKWVAQHDYAVVDISDCPMTTVYEVWGDTWYYDDETLLFTATASRNDFKTIGILANVTMPAAYGQWTRMGGYPVAPPPGNVWPTAVRHQGTGPGGTTRTYLVPNVPTQTYHTMDMTSGQSGSPVLFNFGWQGFVAIGINTHDDFFGDENFGRFIDTDVENFIKANSVDY